MLNFASESSNEEEGENLSFFNEIESFNFIHTISDENNKSSLDQLISFNFKKIDKQNNTFSSFKKPNLFTNTEKNTFLINDNKDNPELNMIFNRKLCCLFEEYLNSEEFGIIELHRLKNEKDEYYLKKYVYLVKRLIEFLFSSEK